MVEVGKPISFIFRRLLCIYFIFLCGVLGLFLYIHFLILYGQKGHGNIERSFLSVVMDI